MHCRRGLQWGERWPVTDTSLWPESNVTDRCRGGVEDGLDCRQVEAMGYTHRSGVGRSSRQGIPCARVGRGWK